MLLKKGEWDIVDFEILGPNVPNKDQCCLHYKDHMADSKKGDNMCVKAMRNKNKVREDWFRKI